MSRELIRAQPDRVKRAVAERCDEAPIDEILALDAEQRELKRQSDEFKAELRLLAARFQADEATLRSKEQQLAAAKQAYELNRKKLAELKRTRDNTRATSTLQSLREAASSDRNLMPYILECVRAYATLGEMCDVLRDSFGVYEEPPFR